MHASGSSARMYIRIVCAGFPTDSHQFFSFFLRRYPLKTRQATETPYRTYTTKYLTHQTTSGSWEAPHPHLTDRPLLPPFSHSVAPRLKGKRLENHHTWSAGHPMFHSSLSTQHQPVEFNQVSSSQAHGYKRGLLVGIRYFRRCGARSD